MPAWLVKSQMLGKLTCVHCHCQIEPHSLAILTSYCMTFRIIYTSVPFSIVSSSLLKLMLSHAFCSQSIVPSSLTPQTCQKGERKETDQSFVRNI